MKNPSATILMASTFIVRTVSLSSAYIKQYEAMQSTVRRIPSLRDPLVVCGPSGVGKGTLINKFMNDSKYKNEASHFGFSVSHTTRQPRAGEEDGIHYHFTNIDKITQAIGAGDFLEYAEVHGNYYGTSLGAIKDVQKEGKICILDIDVQGVKSIKANDDFCANFIFVAPPSKDILRQRLIGRGTETPESVERRTNNALAELEYGTGEGNFDHILVNDNLDEACDNLHSLLKNLYDF